MKIVGIIIGFLLLIGVIWFFVGDGGEDIDTLPEPDIVTDPSVEEIDHEPTLPEDDIDDPVDEANEGEIVEDTSATEKEFTVDSFMYGYSPSEIIVNEGDTVTINLTNSEGMHDWVLDEFDAATEIIAAGEETSVTFVADTAGEYEFYCSVGSHREQGMVGTLIVQ